MTDATGTASQVLGAGGYVTVVDPFPMVAGFRAPITPLTGSNLYTWAGVKPGDHLMLYQASETGAETDFTLVVPTVANATAYNATLLCPLGGGFGNGSGTTLAIESAGCTTADLYVSATDSSGALLATLFHPALAVMAAQTVDLSTSDHFTAAVPATYSYTNLPSTGVQVDYDMVGATGAINGLGKFIDVSAGSAALSIAQPALPANETAFVITDFATTNNTHDVYAWSPTAATSYTLDASTATLPDITALPVFDYSTDTLTWTAGSGVAPDTVLAELDFGNDPDIASWTIVAPYVAGTLQFPPITGMMPDPSDTLDISDLETAHVPGGYDAIRSFALAELDPAVLVELAGTGQALLQSYVGATSDIRHVRVRPGTRALAKRHRH
jgi:hypothetical protein